MHDQERLRELMLAVDVPPTNADIQRAKATGRRRARRNRVAIGVAAMLAVSGTAYLTANSVGRQPMPPGQLPSGPVADCTFDVVQVPAGSQARAVAVDPAGQTVVGTIYTAQWQGNAVRFEDGRIVPYPGATGNAVAISADGLLVGYDEVDQESHTLAWTYRDGKKTMLAKLDGFLYTVAEAVNARGDVVGAAMGDALDDTVPVIWPAETPGTVRRLAVPAGFGEPRTTDSRAVGVSDDGTVVGSAHGAPIRWAPDGTPSALPVPAGYRHARPAALRGHYVYGSVNVVAEHRNAAVRWDLTDGTMKVLDGVPENVTDGTPGGWSLTTGDDSRQPARVTPDGDAESLPRPQSGSAATGMDVFASSISDDGATIAGTTGGAKPRPVIWHC